MGSSGCVSSYCTHNADAAGREDKSHDETFNFVFICSDYRHLEQSVYLNLLFDYHY